MPIHAIALSLLFIAGFFSSLSAQPVQTIRGSVFELISNQPLTGATIALYEDTVLIQGTISDENGKYRLENIPVGRYHLAASYIGYIPKAIKDIVVMSARQTIIDFHLEAAAFEIGEIVIRAGDKKGRAINEMALVSAREFSVDETERYAGSRGDPARMASSFAGVLGNNDNSNDIVVRGNTPIGLLWRMEGINLPNPNHFAVAGNTGGPVGILNNKTLANSDFITGAFPAEYGNTVAGVFDLHLRNGNNEKTGFIGEIGFLGLELLAEGPISKKSGASYLATYRYSTLAAFNALGIDIGTDAIPEYQDASFKLNFPIKKSANLALFGLAGKSKIDILKSETEDPFQGDVFGNANSDEYFRSGMGVLGLKYTQSISSKLLLQATLSASTEMSKNTIFLLDWDINANPPTVKNYLQTQGYKFRQDKYGLSIQLNQNINTRNQLQYGVYTDYYHFNYADSLLNLTDSLFITRLDHKGPGLLIQPFITWKSRISGPFSLVAGLHAQWLDFSSSFVLEPRAGLQWQINDNTRADIGIGQHSQMNPSYIYFANVYDSNGQSTQYNKQLDFLRSTHFILGLEHYFNSNFRIKAEAYYQHLYDVPVTVSPSSYSILNEGDDLSRFFPDSLNNNGTGRNMGIELTLEKFFSQNYFFLITASLFDSKYTASDQKEYSTVFNSNYVVNILGTKEFRTGKSKKDVLSFGIKITWAGGKRYTPIDSTASALAGLAVYDNSMRNAAQFDDYFRADLKINYRINANKATHELGLDLVNIFDTENVFKISYNPIQQKVFSEPQLGFLPIFYYRLTL